MSVSVDKITQSQKQQILSKDEGHFVDLKSIDVTPGKLTKSVSAFANADGGELYVGIDEDKRTSQRSWRGFPTQEAANGHIQTLDDLFPLGQDFSCMFLSCQKSLGLLLKLEIQQTHDIKKASDNIPYIRRGAQNLPVDTDEKLRRLEMNKGIKSFETTTLDAGLSCITNSEPIIKFMLEVVPTAEPEPWLRKQQLIQNDKPTAAGVLLFASEPQAILPKRSAIKLYRYKTRDKEGTRDTLASDPITIEGCAYDQIKAAVEKTVEIAENMKTLGAKGLERISYPPETLHEIITNAVLHRDYSIADDVHVRIFDNRIEIESPGRLPGHVTVANILKERFARNGNIVRIINKFPDPPNKDVGEGLNTAFAAMRRLTLKEPVIEQKENAVVVYIRHEPLASPEEIVLAYLTTHNEMNNRTARRLCHIGSENQMKRIFQRLMRRDLIERVPGKEGSASAYRRKERAGLSPVATDNGSATDGQLSLLPPA